MKYVFYYKDSDSINEDNFKILHEGYTCYLWKPSLLEVVPNGLSMFPFLVWWIMHYLNIFSNKCYGLYLVYNNDKLIHRSVITPRYFRFPFMGEEDLQIGDTWTKTEYRGRGLASFAINSIITSYKKTGRIFWYVVQENNHPSIKAIETSGFIKYGVGTRQKRFGIRVLGFFSIQKLEIKH